MAEERPFDSTQEQTRDSAKERTRALWQDAKEGARSMLDEHKRSAASGICDLADALRTSARNLSSNEQATVARLAQSAADGLEQLSGAIERRDLDGWVREAESFARRRPIAFFGAAVAAGFLAARFLKSSQTHR